VEGARGRVEELGGKGGYPNKGPGLCSGWFMMVLVSRGMTTTVCVPVQLNIANPATGQQHFIELDDEKKL
jgi:hypothetical protein